MVVNEGCRMSHKENVGAVFLAASHGLPHQVEILANVASAMIGPNSDLECSSFLEEIFQDTTLMCLCIRVQTLGNLNRVHFKKIERFLQKIIELEKKKKKQKIEHAMLQNNEQKTLQDDFHDEIPFE